MRLSDLGRHHRKSVRPEHFLQSKSHWTERSRRSTMGQNVGAQTGNISVKLRVKPKRSWVFLKRYLKLFSEEEKNRKREQFFGGSLDTGIYRSAYRLRDIKTHLQVCL